MRRMAEPIEFPLSRKPKTGRLDRRSKGGERLLGVSPTFRSGRGGKECEVAVARCARRWSQVRPPAGRVRRCLDHLESRTSPFFFLTSENSPGRLRPRWPSAQARARAVGDPLSRHTLSRVKIINTTRAFHKGLHWFGRGDTAETPVGASRDMPGPLSALEGLVTPSDSPPTAGHRTPAPRGPDIPGRPRPCPRGEGYECSAATQSGPSK